MTKEVSKDYLPSFLLKLLKGVKKKKKRKERLQIHHSLGKESIWLFLICMYLQWPTITAEELHFTRHKLASRTKLKSFFSRGIESSRALSIWFSHFYTWNQWSYSWGPEKCTMIWEHTPPINRGVIHGTVFPHSGNGTLCLNAGPS